MGGGELEGDAMPLRRILFPAAREVDKGLVAEDRGGGRAVGCSPDAIEGRPARVARDGPQVCEIDVRAWPCSFIGPEPEGKGRNGHSGVI